MPPPVHDRRTSGIRARALLDLRFLSSGTSGVPLHGDVTDKGKSLLSAEAEQMLKKTALLVLLFPIGIGVGTYAGWKIASSLESAREFGALDSQKDQSFLQTYDLIARLWIANIGSATRLQNPRISPEGRRESLNAVLSIAQQSKSRVTDPATLTLIDAETGVTYVRLAMVEEEAGNLPSSQAWMQKAQATLKQAGWKDCSETHLKELAQDLNKRDGV